MPSIPGPSALLGVAGKGYDALERAIGLVPRLDAVLTTVEALVARVDVLVDGIEQTQDRASTVVTDIEQTQARAATVVAAAADAAAHAEALTARVSPLLDAYEPTLQRLEPTLARLAESTDPDEVAAIVAMVDLLPELVAKMQTDIIPVLDTLATVAPDLRDLLDVSKELNEMLGALPGLGRVKRRIEKEQAAEDAESADAHLADEEPPKAPARASS